MPDLTEQLRALVADWRDQAKRLRNEVPNLRDGTDKRFAAACDADQAADELSALLAAAEGVERDVWIAVEDRLPTEDEWPVGKIRTALTFHPDCGIRAETMRPEHWNQIDRRGPSYHGPKVTHWCFPTYPAAMRDSGEGRV